MVQAPPTSGLMRRTILQAATGGVVALAAPWNALAADDINDAAIIEQLLGRPAQPSPRVVLDMPAVFGNGYSVPMTFTVDSPMTEAEHVRAVHVIAPKNPIRVVAVYHFTPQSGRAAVATRIRLAQPQTVLAVADMNDGALLMTGISVRVDTNGCN